MSPAIFYLHHAGGLPCVPRNLAGALSDGRRTVVAPLRYAEAGGSIEEFASNAIESLVARAERLAPGPRILYGHSMGGVVAYEVCRQLGGSVRRHLDHVILAAAAPGWRRASGQHVARVVESPPPESRLHRHLEALRAYEPHDLRTLATPVVVLYSPRDPLVAEADAREWSSAGWATIGFHEIQTDSHLFHVDRAQDALSGFWRSFRASSLAG